VGVCVSLDAELQCLLRWNVYMSMCDICTLNSYIFI